MAAEPGPSSQRSGPQPSLRDREAGGAAFELHPLEQNLDRPRGSSSWCFKGLRLSWLTSEDFMREVSENK